MIYTVNFHNVEQDRPDFSVFQNLDDARAFITSRPADYGESYVITEASEDGEHSVVVGEHSVDKHRVDKHSVDD